VQKMAKRVLFKVASRFGFTPRGVAGYYAWN
jgi:hypothetical protein